MPIDERAIVSVRRTTASRRCPELNLQVLKGRLGYGQLGLPMPDRRVLFEWRRRESNPQITKV